jgi:hypothetical protein
MLNFGIGSDNHGKKCWHTCMDIRVNIYPRSPIQRWPKPSCYQVANTLQHWNNGGWGSFTSIIVSLHHIHVRLVSADFPIAKCTHFMFVWLSVPTIFFHDCLSQFQNLASNFDVLLISQEVNMVEASSFHHLLTTVWPLHDTSSVWNKWELGTGHINESPLSGDLHYSIRPIMTLILFFMC